MIEIIGKTQVLVMMYLPVIFTYLIQLISFIVNYNRVKRISVKQDVSKALAPSLHQLITLNERLEMAIEQSKELEKLNSSILQENAVLRADYAQLMRDFNDKVEAQNKILIDLTKKNVEWEAKARTETKKNRGE